MPLVAHPVRSLWGSQPRCARCVCEWLHRKWDGALPTCLSQVVNNVIVYVKYNKSIVNSSYYNKTFITVSDEHCK